MPGREPSALLSLSTATAFAFNTAFYGQVERWPGAGGGRGDADQRRAVRHAPRSIATGAGADLGAAGSGRTGLLAELLREDGVKLVGTTRSWSGCRGPTRWSTWSSASSTSRPSGPALPEIEKLLDRASSRTWSRPTTSARSSIARSRRSARSTAAPRPASPRRERADPARPGLARRRRHHVRRTVGRLAVLLARDPRCLGAGAVAARRGALPVLRPAPGLARRAVPYLNPHLVGSMRRATTRCARSTSGSSLHAPVVINSGVGSRETIARRLLELLG